jgi:DNA-binding NarL/FixJ family response regulator
MSNSVNITGSDFGELTKALSAINRAAAKANAKIDSMFQFSATGSKLFASLDALNGKLAVARIRADGLATALKGLKGIGTIKVLSGGGSGGGGGGGGKRSGKSKGGFWVDNTEDAVFRNPANDLKNNFSSSLHAMLQADKFNKKMESLREKKRIKDEKDAERRAREEARQEELASRKRQKLIAESAPSNTLYNLTKQAWHRRLTAQNLFGFKSGMGLDPNGTGNPFMVSRFGNPGQMPLMSRFRVFQRPFPGSERNPFALGDAANIMNNGVYSAGRGIEGLFKGITSAGSDSVRALTGFTQIGLAAGTALGSMIPGIGKFVAVIGQGLMAGLDIASKTLTFFVDSLSKAIGGLANFVTNLTLGVSGILSRAVQAASALTELENAAKVYVGKGSGQLVSTSMDYQAKYGISATDSLRLMTRVAGQIRQTTTLSSDEAAQHAIDIFKASAEAGSVLNMSIDDIGKTIQSALAGRYTPLRRIGVAASAPSLDAFYKSNSGGGKPGTMFEGRMMSLVSEFKRQTLPFAGDLEKTQYEFANQQRKILGLFEGMFVQLGRVVEPFAKGLLIVSNTLLGTVYDKLKGFAEGAKSSIEDIRAGGSGGGFGSALKSFVYAVSRAGDYVYAFGQAAYDARDTLMEYGKAFGISVLNMARDLVVFSLKMTGVFVKIIESFGGFETALKDMGNTIISISEFIARQSGYQSPAQKEADRKFYADQQLVEGSKRLSRENRGMIARPGTRLPGESKAVLEAQKRIQAIASGSPRSFVYGTQDMAGSGAGDRLMKLAESLQNIKGIDDLKEFFSNTFGNVPDSGAWEEVLKRLAMSTEREAKFQPLPPMAEKGRLSSYFSPAAFRDEIQGADRGLNAAEETAANTAEMATYLKKLNESASVNSLLSGGKVAYLGA